MIGREVTHESTMTHRLTLMRLGGSFHCVGWGNAPHKEGGGTEKACAFWTDDPIVGQTVRVALLMRSCCLGGDLIVNLAEPIAIGE